MKELRVLLLPFSLALCACSPCADSEESPGSKSEYSILQVEHADRDEAVTKPTFASREKYVLLVAPNQRKDGNIVIMLRPEYPPFYKQVPRGSYRISPEMLSIVANRRLASTTVRESLASHVSE